MKTFESSNGKQFHVRNASAITSGYGHKQIIVWLSIKSTGIVRSFSAVTDNMRSYDAATDLEGQEKAEALYEIIASKIADDVHEWLRD